MRGGSYISFYLIVGNDSSLIQLREKVKSEKKYDLNCKDQKDIPLTKIAAVAAGLVYNENITNLAIYSKRMLKKLFNSIFDTILHVIFYPN